MNTFHGRFHEILEGREQRALYQKMLLKEFGIPLVSFTLNIPGPDKNNGIFDQVHHEGVKALEDEFEEKRLAVVHKSFKERASGLEGFFVVKGDVANIKRLTVSIEENHSLGRLFDFDVIREDGHPISRGELGLSARKCILCKENAIDCRRNNHHTLEELLNHLYHLIQAYGLNDTDVIVES